MRHKARTVIIGLDGVPFGLLRDLSETGIMPNTKKIIGEGMFKRMSSSIPEISAVAWTSFITGSNPGQHGIFGFTELFPKSYRLKFNNFDDLKTPPFWKRIDKTSVIINVPSTYPVKPMEGVHISGFVSIELEKSVYPKSLIPKLKELDYRMDVDSELAHKSMDLFLEDLDKALKSRTECFRYLWDKYDWGLFMFVFTETDRLLHFLWDAYGNENHKYHDKFLSIFGKIDDAIGEICSKIRDGDSLIILSDHGFERLDKNIYVNYLLEKEGFLKFKGMENRELSDIDSHAKAFAMDPARIYLNRKEKYPKGSIEAKEGDKLIRDLERLFKSLKIEGRKAIRDIYRKEEIYSGPFLDQAPDLVLVADKGFNLKASINAKYLTSSDIFTGKHTQDDAFLLMSDCRRKRDMPKDPDVSDVLTICEIYGSKEN